MIEHCEFCSDSDGQPEVLYLHARCHPSAPLRAELENGTLALFCYIPECNRLVAQFMTQVVEDT